MNKKDFAVIGISVVVAVCAVFFAGKAQLGSDFAGGITPNQLFTASVANNYVAPIGSLAIAAQNGLYVGGTNQYNELTNYVTASGTPATVATLNAFNTATGTTATTSITLSYVGNLSVGAICSGSAATTTVYVSGCILATTNGATGTATVAYSNITGSSLAVPTSTRLNITFDQLPY